MSNNEELESKRVAQEEWDFAEIFNFAIDNENISVLETAFYYEFLREIPSAPKAVCYFQNQMKLADEILESTEEFQDAKFKEGKLHGHKFMPIIWFLFDFKHFPDAPITNVYRELEEGFCFGYRGSPIREISYTQIMLATDHPSAFHPDTVASQAFRDSFKKIMRKHVFGDIEHHSEFMALGINWNYSDTEILDAVKETISRNRPEKYANNKTKQKRDPLLKALPFSYDYETLLTGLGVFRRFRNCSWSEYVKLYPPPNGQDAGNYKREQGRYMEKAQKALKWFHSHPFPDLP
ncbi:hypothetical protein [Pontiella sulfatireligans]|uniref:Uncharacterized protein n=1 Tax=Pontiella sulfatireligans TaxID=2750658 RepID=A0A6C2UG86_9BACT|nr:hypothetical protein [Pontiella sulfatireligans]VGO18226.1 hypothetical protein SCARR_00277 [Pontiella sulfatireligans]